MFSTAFALLAVCLYISILFFIALWIEWYKPLRDRLSKSSVIYTLSLGVYCTAWTYYGSVGKAATSGMLFLAIYLGPTLAISTWCLVLRKLVRIKNTHRITSIADFISSRYNKSQGLAAIVTVIALIGNLPYIALQLKAIFSTFHIITGSGSFSPGDSFLLKNVDTTIVILLILFTIVMGVRRLDPTERHPGMMSALAFESLIKLAGFLAVGIFVTYFMHHGFNDIFKRILEEPAVSVIKNVNTGEGNNFITWITYLVLSMSAIMFLPRQFHVSVVENSNEGHIHKAMWLLPLYLLLINIFVYPIAMGGLLAGNPVGNADTFVLRLPMEAGKHWLSLFVFIGGFSAASGMVIAASMTISTMVTNHLLLPVISEVRPLGFLRRRLLECRWLAVAGFILLGYWFEKKIGASYMLVNIGMIAFAAVMQFAPAILAGLFWKKANKRGAIFGITAGFLVWAYTLLLPSFVKSGWLSNSLLTQGPWGIEFLRPEHMFGISILDPLSHGVFWSMMLNIGLLIACSMYTKQEKEEERIADEFVTILTSKVSMRSLGESKDYIDLAQKKKIIEDLFKQYLPQEVAVNAVDKSLIEAGVQGKKQISILKLAEFNSTAEKLLSGCIGSAAAHKVFKQMELFSGQEESDLQKAYAAILVDLKLTPEELKSRIDYYQEREALLTQHSYELETKINELEQNILERKLAEEALQKIQNELEKRVQERTKDLSSINERLGEEINERKEAEIALRESKQRLADIINFSPDPNFVIDMEGKVIAWNKAMEVMSGVRAQDILGKGDYEYSLPFYGERRPILINLATMRGVDDTQTKYPSVKKDKDTLMAEIFLPKLYGKGAFVWAKAAPLYDVNGAIIGAIETMRDITERKRVEEELKRNYDTQAVISSLLRLSLEDISLNEVLERSLDIILGVSWLALEAKGAIFTVEDGSNVLVMSAQRNLSKEIIASCKRLDFGRCLCGRAALNKDIVFASHIDSNHEITYEGILAHGHYCVPILSVDKRTIGVINLYIKEGYVTNGREEEFLRVVSNVLAGIIQRKHAEDELEDAYEKLKTTQSQLIQSSKMAAVGQLASGVAHEINNPLTGVLNNAQLIKMEVESGQNFKIEDFKELLSIIEESALRCKRITQSLLDFSHASKGILQPVSLNDTVDKVFTFIFHELKLGNISINKELQEDLPKIQGDSQLLQQVVFDLINNAKWAIENKIPKEGGTITIKTEYEAEEKLVTISISDTGMGILKENLAKIFDPFFTTKTVGEGTGLGLAIVYNIVKAHKGVITATSEPGQGTTFKMSFPVFLNQKD